MRWLLQNSQMPDQWNGIGRGTDFVPKTDA